MGRTRVKGARALAAKRHRPARSRPPRKGSETPSTKAPGAAPSASHGLVRGDQFGAILTKGLDLAEASLSLGLSMITRVGASAQQQMERIAAAIPQDESAPDAAAYASRPAERPPAAGARAAHTPPDETAVPEEGQSGITNRLPVTQGSTVRISFSINNDSVAAPKLVVLRADDFIGELEGARIEAARFAVKPQRRRIAPMDFEKFVLEGDIPADVPSDVYHGAIVVSSGQAFSIPVRLIVQGT